MGTNTECVPHVYQFQRRQTPSVGSIKSFVVRKKSRNNQNTDLVTEASVLGQCRDIHDMQLNNTFIFRCFSLDTLIIDQINIYLYMTMIQLEKCIFFHIYFDENEASIFYMQNSPPLVAPSLMLLFSCCFFMLALWIFYQNQKNSNVIIQLSALGNHCRVTTRNKFLGLLQVSSNCFCYLLNQWFYTLFFAFECFSSFQFISPMAYIILINSKTYLSHSFFHGLTLLGILLKSFLNTTILTFNTLLNVSHYTNCFVSVNSFNLHNHQCHNYYYFFLVYTWKN